MTFADALAAYLSTDDATVVALLGDYWQHFDLIPTDRLED